MAAAEIGATLDILPAPGPAGGDGPGFRLGNPPIRVLEPATALTSWLSNVGTEVGAPVDRPVGIAVTLAGIDIPGAILAVLTAGKAAVKAAIVGAEQVAERSVGRNTGTSTPIRAIIGIGGAAADPEADGFLAAAGFLGELKNEFAADAGNAGFAVSEVALLGGEEAAEVALLAEIDGVVAFVAVAAGKPGFGLGLGVGLVDGAVDGLAAVGGEGFEDHRDAGVIGVGNGRGLLPVGAVPGDGSAAGLGIAVPPPLRKSVQLRPRPRKVLA